MTADEVSVATRLERRVFRAAAVLGFGATGMKMAPLRALQRAGDLAGERRRDMLADDRLGNRGEERNCVWVGGSVEYILIASEFDDSTKVHNCDAVTNVPDDPEVVRNEHEAQPETGLQIGDEVQNLRLDGYIESRGRLVADHQTRFGYERTRDGDALALTTAEGMWKAHFDIRRQSDEAQRPPNPFGYFRPTDAKRAQWFTDDVAHSHSRIERRHRVLKNRLHGAAQRANCAFVEVSDVAAFELDPTARRWK
jgi:hypothetical protein